MATTNLDQIGAEAARLWAESENSRKLAQPLIKQVWDAYTAAEEAGTAITINGASSKTEWAKQAKIGMRYCQYVSRDGDRKRSEKEKDANRVRLEGLRVSLGDWYANGIKTAEDGRQGFATFSVTKESKVRYTATYNTARQRLDIRETTPKKKNGHIDTDAPCEYTHTVEEIAGKLTFEVYIEGATEKEVFKALVKKSRENLTALRLWDKSLADKMKEVFEQNIEEREENKANEKKRRSRASLKASAMRRARSGDQNMHELQTTLKGPEAAMHPAAHELEKTLAATTDAVSVPQQDCPIAEQITEITPNGYYAKLNRKPKGATQESQPWEIYLTIHGTSKFCARERSKQDAEARCWKLDRIAEEEKHNTPTTAANEAAGAAAM